jgi:tRNA(Ile)-lysidine synthase
MMPQGRVHLRPLLTLKKTDVAKGLKSEKIPWREDSSNAGRRFLRNRMRGDVVPAWIAANADRDAVAGAALSRELLEEDDAALDAWVAEIKPLTARGHLSLRRLAGKPRAVVRRALYRWLAENLKQVALSRQAFAAVLNDIMVGRVTRHSLGVEGFAQITKHRLQFTSATRKLSN